MSQSKKYKMGSNLTIMWKEIQEYQKKEKIRKEWWKRERVQELYSCPWTPSN